MSEIENLRYDVDGGQNFTHALATEVQCGSGDVDGIVGDWLPGLHETVEHQGSLRGATCTEFDDYVTVAGLLYDLGRILAENAALGRSRIILRQLRDALEKLGSCRVIEQFWRQRLRKLGQSVQNIFCNGRELGLLNINVHRPLT